VKVLHEHPTPAPSFPLGTTCLTDSSGRQGWFRDSSTAPCGLLNSRLSRAWGRLGVTQCHRCRSPLRRARSPSWVFAKRPRVDLRPGPVRSARRWHHRTSPSCCASGGAAAGRLVRERIRPAPRPPPPPAGSHRPRPGHADLPVKRLLRNLLIALRDDALDQELLAPPPAPRGRPPRECPPQRPRHEHTHPEHRLTARGSAALPRPAAVGRAGVAVRADGQDRFG
jgi:hypothetical protein